MTKKSTKKRGTAPRATAARRAPAPRKPRTVNFNDEEDVLAEVAKILDLDPSNCRIKRGSASNGHGDAYEITCGRQEYIVMETDDEFETAAVEGVESDLNDNPEMFPVNFIRQHVNIDRLRRDLHSDVYESNYKSAREEAERQPEKFLRDNSIDFPSPTEKQMREYAEDFSDEDKTASTIYDELVAEDDESRWTTMGEEPDVPDSEIEAVAESQTNAQLKDPISYLEDIYGSSEAVEQAIKIGGIDTKAAAQDVVDTDGAARSMCNYDGNYETTKSGFIVWRHN